jgi:RimJ/RimL family protein N-acetyltransferase
MTIVMETHRLELRCFREDDAEALLRMESDPEVLRHVGRKPLPDAEAYRGHIRSALLRWYGEPGGHGAWAVLEKSTGEFIGGCSLKPALAARDAAAMGYGPDEVAVGYGLRRSSWGKGLATELARGLVRRAFDKLGAARLVASVSAANVRSIRVLEKAGLERENGLFWVPGEDEASLRYALGRERAEEAGLAGRQRG